MIVWNSLVYTHCLSTPTIYTCRTILSRYQVHTVGWLERKVRDSFLPSLGPIQASFCTSPSPSTPLPARVRIMQRRTECAQKRVLASVCRKSRLVMLANVNTSYFTKTRETPKQRTTENGQRRQKERNLDVLYKTKRKRKKVRKLVC